MGTCFAGIDAESGVAGLGRLNGGEEGGGGWELGLARIVGGLFGLNRGRDES